MSSAVELKPITDDDVRAVADFLHAGMSSGTSSAAWRRVMMPPWDVHQPNHGYLLHANGRVVGAYLALYSERLIDGRRQRICNLGAWCVAEEHRANGLRLLRSLLRQPGHIFTDLTPSENVAALNTRLGFTTLDTTTAVIPNLPWPVRSRGVRVVDDPIEIDGSLSGRDHSTYRDHVTTAVHHAVLARGEQSCYVMYRRDRRRRRPPVATILHIGNPDLFRDCALQFYRYLMLRRGIPVTAAEIRILRHRPTRAVVVAGAPKMYLGEGLQPRQIDYLYSELTCLER